MTIYRYHSSPWYHIQTSIGAGLTKIIMGDNNGVKMIAVQYYYQPM
jgi:hypothetical protein